MRILYISDSSVPSASANSIHVMKMCQAWARQGHQVTLLAKHTTACLKEVSDLYAYYGVEPVFQIRRFPFMAFPGSGKLYNLLLPWFGFGAYDLVYTRALYAAFWYSLFNRKIAFEIHEPFDTKSAWLKKVFSYIVTQKKVVKWIVISGALKEYLMTTFQLPTQAVVIAHDGADPVPESVAPVSLAGSFKVGYVGSLLRGKGMELIMPLAAELPEVTFHIVGGSKTDIEGWRARTTLSNVVFHGYVPHAEAYRYMLACDALIAPYQRGVFVKDKSNSNNIAMWMSPLKIFEYMASGKPILTSDLPVLREVLIHRSTALLCNPDDLPQWVAAIHELTADDALRTHLAGRSKMEFEAKYTWYARARFILENINQEQSE